LERERETSSRAQISLSPLFLLGILVSLFAFFFLSKTRNKQQEGRNSIDAQDSTEKERYGGKIQSSVVSEVPPSPNLQLSSQ